MELIDIEIKHTAEKMHLYKEIKELKKDIQYLKKELTECRSTIRFNSHKRGLEGHLMSREIISNTFQKFCELHIHEKQSEYGNLKMGFVTDLFNQWYSNNYPNEKKVFNKLLMEAFEIKYGKYPKGGWTNLSIKE